MDFLGAHGHKVGEREVYEGLRLLDVLLAQGRSSVCQVFRRLKRCFEAVFCGSFSCLHLIIIILRVMKITTNEAI